MDFVSFWRNCERMGFVNNFWRTCERMGFVSSVFGVHVNVRISSVFDVTVIVWVSSRQFLGVRCERMAYVSELLAYL